MDPGHWFEFLEIPEMQRALFVAALAGPACALLGTFITLRGLAFFSDAIAHSALTALTIGFLFNIAADAHAPAMQVLLAAFCVLLACVMEWARERTGLRPDTVLALAFTGSIAWGFVLISRLRGYRVLETALFGDILACTWMDIALIAAVALLVLGVVGFNLRALALSTVNENLARLEGIPVRRLNYVFVVLVALVVALLLRQIGAMLISGLMVIPAAAARFVAPSFRAMLRLAVVFGFVGAMLGLFASYHLDTPTGPTIVLSDLALFGVAAAGAALIGRRRRNRGGAA
jgi:zinc transport system permease protein